MSDDYDADHQLVSALADGELRGEEFSRALDLLGHSERAVAAWDSYHVVGDALRGADVAITRKERAFVKQVRAQVDGAAIARVQFADAPHALPRRQDGAPARLAANDPARRWKWLAAAASVAAAAAIGWPLLGLDSSASLSASVTQPQAAQASSSAEATAGVMLRDPRLDELMAAHKQFGGTSALQMPSGFLRNATFGGPAPKDAR